MVLEPVEESTRDVGNNRVVALRPPRIQQFFIPWARTVLQTLDGGIRAASTYTEFCHPFSLGYILTTRVDPSSGLEGELPCESPTSLRCLFETGPIVS
jgi:hypothetical protein